ncbi:MAG: GGDEF domain-containing protein [Alphaproteobacteria bacterium]|nr:GGDEF domain-containing protein [Alphaproteobacteria bacterium]
MEPTIPTARPRPAPLRSSRGTVPLPLGVAPRLSKSWTDILDKLDFAFQPIVNIHTGYCCGYEALLRHTDEVGFASIGDFFDCCHAQGVLPGVEGVLLAKAALKFAPLPGASKLRLFLNVDNRTLGVQATIDPLKAVLKEMELTQTCIAFEVSERHPFHLSADPTQVIRDLKRDAFKIAIDDFGIGFSGLQLLYMAEPEYLKIDRFFITNIATDAKKKLFLTHMVNVAHVMGVEVIAEGVETEQEFFSCKDIGCDLVQGFMIQRPTCSVEQLRTHYPDIEALSRRERRHRGSDQKIIFEQIERLVPLTADSDMRSVFTRFRDSKNHNFLPVVDNAGEPMGLIRERDLKEFTYSTYGKEIICNKNFGYKITHFIARCPIADVHTPAEKILEIFSANASSEGVIIVENMKYVGFLGAHALLKVINEKNLAFARDQNPLTKLPGNGIIHGLVTEALADRDNAYAFVYFDFDNFKPFNDKYGFRQGDRAILLFAEILTRELISHGASLGHVGGDDFFACFKGMDGAEVAVLTHAVSLQFRYEVESFYEAQDRKLGYIEAQDREGRERRFPLLTVSAAILDLPVGHGASTVEEIGWLIAELKHQAKASPDKLCQASLITARSSALA